MNSYLPEEPENRRVIMVLSSQEIDQLRIDAKSDNSARDLLSNRQVSILDDSVKDGSDLINHLRGSGLLNSGSILIQSPYDPSNYSDVANASYSFAQAKCIHFANLCGLLAAKKVSVVQMEIETSNAKTDFSGELDTPYGVGGAEVESHAWNQMKKAITIEEEYSQGESKLEKANTYLSKHQWLSDPHMTGLLYKRESGIPIKKHKFILNLTKESRRNLNIAFDLTIPVNPSMPIVGKLKGNLEQVKKETFDFSLTINVDFW